MALNLKSIECGGVGGVGVAEDVPGLGGGCEGTKE